MVTCTTCGGRYAPIQRDGTQYFHACPPLSMRELAAALAAGTVSLSDDDAAIVRAATKADAVTPVQADAPTRLSLALGALSVPRPNARNENLVSTREKDKGAMIAPGAGVVEA
jgi:hypothetical protein